MVADTQTTYKPCCQNISVLLVRFQAEADLTESEGLFHIFFCRVKSCWTIPCTFKLSADMITVTL